MTTYILHKNAIFIYIMGLEDSLPHTIFSLHDRQNTLDIVYGHILRRKS